MSLEHILSTPSNHWSWHCCLSMKDSHDTLQLITFRQPRLIYEHISVKCPKSWNRWNSSKNILYIFGKKNIGTYIVHPLIYFVKKVEMQKYSKLIHTKIKKLDVPLHRRHFFCLVVQTDLKFVMLYELISNDFGGTLLQKITG